METLFGNHISLLSHFNCLVRSKRPSYFFKESFRVGPYGRRLSMQKKHPCVISLSKKSAFQDFQDFAKPSRLLPTSNPIIYHGHIPEERISSVDFDEYTSLYVLELETSKDFGSSMSDLNAALLVCLIDAKGDSILQRISPTSSDQMGQGKEMPSSELMPFQRGSVDAVAFKGPKLEHITALWIGLESGSWTLYGLSLKAISGAHPLVKSTGEMDVSGILGYQYEFEAENILLGEKGVSMVELRPLQVTELSGNNFLDLMKSFRSTSPMFEKISNEESMREYADLKLSLLLYDMILISAGSILTYYFSERASYDFLVGGICGFIYLLLLQKSVDGLSPPTSLPSVGELESNISAGSLKWPLLSVTLILGTFIAAMKYGVAGSSISLMPTDIFLGGAGFLTCKLAVLLAAFKPLRRRSFKEN